MKRALIIFPLEETDGTVAGDIHTGMIFLDLGAAAVGADMLCSAIDNMANRTVSSKAMTIAAGRAIQGVHALDSSTVVEVSEADRIVRRLRRRAVRLRTEIDLVEQRRRLTVSANTDEGVATTEFGEEAIRELEQRIRQVQVALTTYETDAERREREEEEASEGRAAAAAINSAQAKAAAAPPIKTVAE